MNKLYQKDETWFAIVWILIYMVGMSIAEVLSVKIGIKSFFTAIFNITLSVVLFVWINRRGLLEKYGLCKAKTSASSMLFYIPLIIIATRNLWRGVGINMPLIESVCYMISMLCVGFIEEVLFRGFLFKGLSKDNLTVAVIVSSLTFAVGHLVHLFNGSNVKLVENLCQVFGAISFGFVCVAVFIRCGSIIPCILLHSVFDILSTFCNQAAITNNFRIISATIQFIIFVPYAIYLLKKANINSNSSSNENATQCDVQ